MVSAVGIRTILLVAFSILPQTTGLQDAFATSTAAPVMRLNQSASFDHAHTEWGTLLGNHVHGVSVDYRGMKEERGALAGYLAELSRVAEGEFEQWTRDQRLAFLINAYNAFTVNLILARFPVDSIRDIGPGSPWKRKSIPLLGKLRSLDEIEHKMIRRGFSEPRIHFAINCASVSCPELRAEAFTAGRLENQLEDAALRFLRDPGKNRFDQSRQILLLSKIFDWYEEDFEDGPSGVRGFVAARITDEETIQRRIRSRAVRVKYLKYDWSLNGRR